MCGFKNVCACASSSNSPSISSDSTIFPLGFKTMFTITPTPKIILLSVSIDVSFNTHFNPCFYSRACFPISPPHFTNHPKKLYTAQLYRDSDPAMQGSYSACRLCSQANNVRIDSGAQLMEAFRKLGKYPIRRINDLLKSKMEEIRICKR